MGHPGTYLIDFVVLTAYVTEVLDLLEVIGWLSISVSQGITLPKPTGKDSIVIGDYDGMERSTSYIVNEVLRVEEAVWEVVIGG